MAIDDSGKGRRFGEWVLIDALTKLLAASGSVAFPVVIVDAKDDAKSFRCVTDFNNFKTWKISYSLRLQM